MISGIRSFDELNELVGKSRSEPYETYFGEMDLSEEEIKKTDYACRKIGREFSFRSGFVIHDGTI